MFQLRIIAWSLSVCGFLAGALSGLSLADEAEAPRLLFLGNSITLHGPAEGIGWTGNWGMAASAEEKDYVHLVVDAVAKSSEGKPKSKVVNLADFERGFEQYDIVAKLKAEVEFQADTLVLAIGENVPQLTTQSRAEFRDSVSRLLKHIKGDTGCSIYVRSCFWPDAMKDSALKEACETVGGIFVDINALSKDERNYARSERKIAHAGVAAHPGDRGMRAIADRILAAMATRDGPAETKRKTPNN